MIQSLIQNLQQDIAILQHYTKQRQSTGFHDMETLIESIVKKFLNLTENLNLTRLELIKVNFPAIDLADDAAKVAVQVTTNAVRKKILKTIKTFESFDLDKRYSRLIVLGFCSSEKIALSKNGYEIKDISDLVKTLVDIGNEEHIESIGQTIRMHNDYTRVHPYSDIDCLNILINTLDRNAIKHRMSSEGDYSAMVKGLNEITELISKGQINKKEKSKSIDDFFDNDIVDFMRNVRNDISEILAIVNKRKQKQSDFVCLYYNDMEEIDNLKLKIVERTNSISILKSIPFRMEMY
jgi:hypothetical protein